MRKNSCKILCSALAFIYLCSCFSPAFSEDLYPYILDDAGTCISMPAGLIVFTKDSTKDDPYLLRYGLTTEQFVNYMAENLLSLVGFDQMALLKSAWLWRTLLLATLMNSAIPQ